MGCLGSVAAAVVLWASTPECYPLSEPSGRIVCTRTGAASDLSQGPWTYLGLSVALLLLAVFLFTLREQIRARS
jgi:hypothetical protein